MLTLLLIALLDTTPVTLPTLDKIERIEVMCSTVWGHNWMLRTVDAPSSKPSQFSSLMLPLLRGELVRSHDPRAIGNFYKEQFPKLVDGKVVSWVYPKPIHDRGTVCYYRIKVAGTFRPWTGPIPVDFSRFWQSGTDYNLFTTVSIGGHYFRPWHGVTQTEYTALIAQICQQQDIPTWEVTKDLYLKYLLAKTGKDWRSDAPSKPSPPKALKTTEDTQ